MTDQFKMAEKQEIERKAAAMVMAAAELNSQEVGTGRQFFTLRFMRAVAELEAVSQARLYDILTAEPVKEKDQAVDAMMTLNKRALTLLGYNRMLDKKNHELLKELKGLRQKTKTKRKD